MALQDILLQEPLTIGSAVSQPYTNRYRASRKVMACRVVVRDEPIWYTTDGTTPSSTVGSQAEAGAVFECEDPGQVLRLRMTRAGATDSRIDLISAGQWVPG